MKRVLIVDDASFMRMSIKNMLANYDFEVNITMPEMDGLEALREIKKIDPGASVVMVSALGQEARMKEAIIYGAKGFIVKPFKEEMLISALSKL